jgi:ABC-2 type transport system ATP-binding protein
MESILSVRGLRKAYGDFVAVDDVSLEIGRGETLGLLGPNGAGKTTTLECVEGLRKPDAGRIRIAGADPARDASRMREAVGVQLQTSGLPATMTPAEAMAFVSAYRRRRPRKDLFERLGLAELRDKRYGDLSVGQQRRLALALAIAHRPALLFLDEPTAGLDVGARVELHALMAELRDEGTAILLATHDMAEAEKMADRLAILLGGRVVAEGTPREITAAGDGLTKVSVSTERGTLLHGQEALPAVERMTSAEEYLVCMSVDPGPTVSAILARIEANGDALIDLRVERPSLEERFLEITSTEVAA